MWGCLASMRRALLKPTVQKIWGDKRGGIAVLFGIVAPVLLLLLCGGTELADVMKARRELQWDVDTAALNGARELGTDQSSATATRAQNMAASLAAQSTPHWTVSTTAQIDATQGTVTVSQTATRSSYFGNLLVPGGWHIGVSSTAIANQKLPLCVLALQNNGNVPAPPPGPAGAPTPPPPPGPGPGATNLALHATSTVTATGCLVQSNSSIGADKGASMQAAAVRSVGAATGSIIQAPITDAPAIADPFASLNISVPSTCSDNGLNLNGGTQSLNPGVHCGNIHLQGDAVLTLNPGEHYFVNGQFNLDQTSQVTGSDVVLIFKGNWKIQCAGGAVISLEGRHSGPYAGFVLVTDRTLGGVLTISTNNARQLYGTIYLPNATLDVTGTGNQVADQSPWTVVVAMGLTTDGSAKLVINSNYAGASVPVPVGVGSSGMAHLSN